MILQMLLHLVVNCLTINRRNVSFSKLAKMRPRVAGLSLTLRLPWRLASLSATRAGPTKPPNRMGIHHVICQSYVQVCSF